MSRVYDINDFRNKINFLIKQIYFLINLTMKFIVIGHYFLNFGILLSLISLQCVMTEPTCWAEVEEIRLKFILTAHKVCKWNSFKKMCSFFVRCIYECNDDQSIMRTLWLRQTYRCVNIDWNILCLQIIA